MSVQDPITSDMFDALMAQSFSNVFDDVRVVAVGVSGGADSMALLWLLQGWAAERGIYVYALSVDHGLRVDAAGECKVVAEYCEGFEHVEHVTLKWLAPCDVRVQEEARKARYALMSEYCAKQDVQHLFLGHHADDQAETFLFRLAKGSGLDGLSGMVAMQAMDHEMGDIILCRPLLRVPKDALVTTCGAQDISFIDDPSNDDDEYARVRLRAASEVLAKEGLSAKRLGVTAMRMARARYALDHNADCVFKDNALYINTTRIEFNNKLCLNPDEIVIRVLLLAMDQIGLKREYAARMEKVEALAHSLKYDLSFRKRTLGGVIFERDEARGRIVLKCENRKN